MKRCKHCPLWIGGSFPIGAGFPDLLIASYKPEMIVVEGNNVTFQAKILAYLRHVASAKLKTISDKTGINPAHTSSALSGLVGANAVRFGGASYSLSSIWRNILPDTLAIEAKVTHWRNAVRQAERNTLFVHRSFVALPTAVATRVASEPEFGKCRLGILAVDNNGHVRILRRAPRQSPTIWYYYYYLALRIARETVARIPQDEV